jgi:hypothetical protein
VIGAHGADQRSMHRAKRLGLFRSLAEAKEIAEPFHATAEGAPTPYEILAPLEHGPPGFRRPAHPGIEPAAAGVYTIWDGASLI